MENLSRFQIFTCLLIATQLPQKSNGFNKEVPIQDDPRSNPEYLKAISMASCQARCFNRKTEKLPQFTESEILIIPAICVTEDCTNCIACFENIKNGTFDIGHKQFCPRNDYNFEQFSEKLELDTCTTSRPENMNLTYFKGYPAPNILFHCSGQNSLKTFDTYIKFNFNFTQANSLWADLDIIPRYFVVEKEINGVWIQDYQLITPFWLLKIDTELNFKYRFRISAVSRDVVYEPRVSELIKSFEMTKRLTRPPKNARVLKFDMNYWDKKPKAIIRWESGSGLNATCRSLIHILPQIESIEDDDHRIQEITKPYESFQNTITDLEFGKKYDIKIFEHFGNAHEEIAEIFFQVPSCNSFQDLNHTVHCPPLSPTNLMVSNETEDSFLLSWDKPKDVKNQKLSYELIVYREPVTVHHDSIQQDSESSTQDLQPLTILHTNPNVIYKNASIPGNLTSIWIPKSNHIRIEMRAVDEGQGQVSISVLLSYKFRISNKIPKKRFEPDNSQIGFIISISIGSLFFVIILTLLYFVFKSYRLKSKRRKQHIAYFENLDKEPIQATEPMLPVSGYEESFKWKIEPKSLVLQNIIGEGQFGVVRKAILYRDGQILTVACKTLRDGVDDREMSKFWEEFDILKGLGPHKNIVGLIGVIKENFMHSLIVEYCCNGDLQSYLRKAFNSMVNRQSTGKSTQIFLDPESKTGSRVSLSMVTNEVYFMDREEAGYVKDQDLWLTELNLLSFARQICIGMEYLAKNKIVHRDLASRNILVGQNLDLKIADFGLSRDVYEQNLYKKSSNGKIPFKWLAIESLIKEVYTTQSDVWSYGILLWEIVTYGGIPYPGLDNTKLFELLSSGYRMSQPEGTSPELYKLMTKCWQEDPLDRPDFYTIRKILDEIIENYSQVHYINLLHQSQSSLTSSSEDLKKSPINSENTQKIQHLK